MIDRREMTEELLLRENIRKILKYAIKKRKKEEFLIKEVIRSVLQEVAVSDKIPHASTGINELEKLLKKIVPILQDAYISMTTSEEQRSSFSGHIMNAAENSITTANTNQDALSEAIEIDIDDDEEDAPPEFIDIEDDEVEEEEIPEEEKFATGVDDQGLDKTGRNIAFQTYKQIEQQILDAYGILANSEDRGVFQEYLLINLKLYFQKFEQEMEPSVEGPDVEIPAGSEEAAVEDDIEMDDLGF